jgi:D-alanyl-D-alanine carboxypeptidase
MPRRPLRIAPAVQSGRRRTNPYPIVVAGVILVSSAGLYLHRRSSKNIPGVSVTAAPTPVASAAVAAATAVPNPTQEDPSFIKVVNECVIPIANLYGFNLYVSADFRSYDEQQVLYNQGRTVNGHIVTQARGGQSMHNFGLAVDFADHADGNNLDYGELTAINSWCGLEHGDRGFLDLPHYEYRGGLTLAQLQAGFRPKPIALPCATLDTKAQDSQTITRADLTACGAPNFAASSTGKTSGGSGE